MLTFYENAFSPFARKVRLVLEHKQLEFTCVDGLSLSNRDALAAVNGRVEVPAIDHDGVVVTNSSDIVAYLDRVFPERPVLPAEPASFVKARAWERCSDTVVDAILIDISYWTWAIRPDRMPEGLLDAARRDLGEVYASLDATLAASEGPFVAGACSVADFALFPQLSASKALGVPFDEARHPHLMSWFRHCRQEPLFVRDLERTRAYVANAANLDIEREKIFWRGDRIEWLLASGQHRWFMKEIEEGRVLWPGLGIPAPG